MQNLYKLLFIEKQIYGFHFLNFTLDGTILPCFYLIFKIVILMDT